MELLSGNAQFGSKSAIFCPMWPWNLMDDIEKNTGHFFPVASSFVHHFIAISEFKIKLQSGNTQFGSKSAIYCPVWPRNLTDDTKNYRAPLLCRFKLYASFHSHQWIQTKVTVQKRSVQANITLRPHEAGIWAKHPSLTLPAPSRYRDQQTPWLQLSAGGAHPVSIDCWLEWPVGLIHAGHAWSPPGIISKMTRRLVEFWKSLNHNST